MKIFGLEILNLVFMDIYRLLVFLDNYIFLLYDLN